MKRFFCTVCKKMKRVRKYPVIIETPAAGNPMDRIGVCNWHSSVRSQSFNTIRREKVSQ